MWYVMQVASGKENQTLLLLEKMIPKEILEQSFLPVRKLKKKFKGKWNEITEKLFPSYVFLISGEPQKLYETLKDIPAMTKLLGNCEEYFTALSEQDVQTLKKLQNWDEEKQIPVAELSQIQIEEGNQIHIISGPLKNLQGQIKKINLHKRIAIVEVEFMGNTSLVHLGIEMVEKIKM